MLNPFATLDDISMSTFDEYVFVEGEIYKASGFASDTAFCYAIDGFEREIFKTLLSVGEKQ